MGKRKVYSMRHPSEQERAQELEHATLGSVISFHPTCGRASIPALLFVAVLMCSYSGAYAQYFASRVTDAYVHPEEMINANGTVFFSADDGTGVRGLWKSDGTADGTVLVKAIPPAIGSLTGVGATLFFV